MRGDGACVGVVDDEASAGGALIDGSDEAAVHGHGILLDGFAEARERSLRDLNARVFVC